MPVLENGALDSVISHYRNCRSTYSQQDKQICKSSDACQTKYSGYRGLVRTGDRPSTSSPALPGKQPQTPHLPAISARFPPPNRCPASAVPGCCHLSKSSPF